MRRALATARLKRPLTRFADEGGVAVIEAAIAFPFLVILMAGLFEFGLIFYNFQLVQTGVRDAGRYLSRVPDLAAAEANAKETGAPQCYSGGSVSDDPDRRTFHGAILDCRALDQQYNISGGSAPPLPVTAYAKFFLAEPVDKQDGTIWVELVDVVEPGTPAAKEILRESVQLYR